MRRWHQASAANWSNTTIAAIRIHKTGITYLSQLVEIYAAVAPDLGSELEKDNFWQDSDPQDWYHLPFCTDGNRCGRWRQASAVNWSGTNSVAIRICKTGITYLSKLVEIDAAVAPGLCSELEQDNLCRD
jgi:hypothetical protein